MKFNRVEISKYVEILLSSSEIVSWDHFGRKLSKSLAIIPSSSEIVYWDHVGLYLEFLMLLHNVVVKKSKSANFKNLKEIFNYCTINKLFLKTALQSLLREDQPKIQPP